MCMSVSQSAGGVGCVYECESVGGVGCVHGCESVGEWGRSCLSARPRHTVGRVYELVGGVGLCV